MRFFKCALAPRHGPEAYQRLFFAITLAMTGK